MFLLGGTLAWYAWHGLPVHYIPPWWARPVTAGGDLGRRRHGLRQPVAHGPLHLYPGPRQDGPCPILTALHPSLTVAFTAQAAREVALVKGVRLSTQVMIATATVTRRTPQEVTVRLEARRTIWIGGQQVRDEPVPGRPDRGALAGRGGVLQVWSSPGHHDPRTQCRRPVAGARPPPCRRE